MSLSLFSLHRSIFLLLGFTEIYIPDTEALFLIARDRFSSLVPKVIPSSTALVQSSQFLCSEIPARASKRLEQLKLFRNVPGIDRLIEPYEYLASCPYPGYAHGQLREMDAARAGEFGTWMEQGLKTLEQVHRFEQNDG
jgi:hypothetical protein